MYTYVQYTHFYMYKTHRDTDIQLQIHTCACTHTYIHVHMLSAYSSVQKAVRCVKSQQGSMLIGGNAAGVSCHACLEQALMNLLHDPEGR